MKVFVAILMVVLLSGCSSLASLNPPPAYYEAQIARISAAQALAEKPMVEIECTTGCRVSVLNPNGASSIGTVKEGTTTGKVALAAVGGIKDLGKSLAVVRAVDKVMSAAGDRNVTIAGNDNSLDMDNTDINTTNSKSSTTSGNVTGDTSGNTTGDTTGDTVGATSGDVITSGDVSGDTHGPISGDTSGDVRGDETNINDSYNPTTTTTTETVTTSDTNTETTHEVQEGI